MTERFKSSLVENGTDFGWLLFDLQNKCLVQPLCDYADDMVLKAQLSPLTVDQEMGYLRVFWSYLASRRIAVERVTDTALQGFKDWALDRTKKGPAHRGSDEAARKTTNAKLIRVYDWLCWMQNTGRVSPGLIGQTGARVTSSLQRSAILHRSRSLDSIFDRFPLIYRLKSGKSKHGLAKFVPTEDTVDAVHIHFHESSSSPYVARRNCLLTSVASYAGFRRASIQSLVVSQFVGADFVRTAFDSVIIQPARQKNDYGDTFELPTWLHDQVVDFIEGPRKDLLKRKRVGATQHKGAVFLSAKTGTPLNDRTLTAIMSRALRAIGAGKGAAMHAWRAKFAVEETIEKYSTRRRLGLDTSIATMDTVVARALGHKNPDSARPYTSSYEAAEVARVRAARNNEHEKNKSLVAELKLEVLRLTEELRLKVLPPTT